MTLSALADRSKKPEPRQLADVLGRSSGLWVTLTGDLRSRYDPLVERWNFSGTRYGWSLALKHNKRNVLYLIPQRGHFLAAFALGGKAIAAAHASDLPQPVLEAINRGRQHPEGRSVRLEVRRRRDLMTVERLAAIKMAN